MAFILEVSRSKIDGGYEEFKECGNYWDRGDALTSVHYALEKHYDYVSDVFDKGQLHGIRLMFPYFQGDIEFPFGSPGLGNFFKIRIRQVV